MSKVGLYTLGGIVLGHQSQVEKFKFNSGAISGIL